MKLLFVITKYYPKVGGTPNCVRNLIKHIRDEHDIQVLTTKDFVNEQKNVNCEGLAVHKELSFSHIAMRDILKGEGMSAFTRFCALIGKTFYKYIPIEHIVLRLKFRRRIKKLQKKENFDWVIAVSGDIIPAIAVMSCKGLKNTCFYQLDPYSTNATLPKSREGKRLITEQKIHNSFDLLITTETIKNEMSQRFAVSNNLVVCNFPNITDRTKIPDRDVKAVRCLFCGAMYAARNIDRALEIIRSVTSRANDIYFDFYVLGDTSAIKREISINPNVCLFDAVSPDEIFNVMNEHDVLFNIGNVMTNQVPSKIYDYISTGMPIVNFCYNSDCPTVSVLEPYPMALNLLPEQNIEESAERVIEFIRTNVGKRVGYDVILDNYYENSIACVAERMLSDMKRIGDNK